ncbi:MAG TPA: OmpH family outer membrane protein [Minicystis sp.]|nr:OmpH family outer membrane protein [Minicystis sp.]
MRRPFAFLAAAALGAAALSAAPSAHAEGSKIAVVDMQRAVVETQAGAAAQATLKKLFTGRQAELEAKQKQLQVEKDALDKAAKAGKTKQAELQQKAEQLQKEYADYQQKTLQYQREMQQKEGELTQPILQGILGVVRRIAAKEGYEIVLEKSAAPYFRSDLDVTDKAIQMFNQEGGPAAAPPSKPAPAPAKPKK